MKKTFRKSWFRLILLVAVAGGLGYVRLPVFAVSALPEIKSFTVSSPAITSGEAVTLDWQLVRSGPAKILADVTAATYAEAPIRLEPQLSTAYTLVAQNRRGSAQETRLVSVSGAAVTSGGAGSESGGAATASGGGGSSENDAPEGTLGVSLNLDGPFVNDGESSIRNRNDPRAIKVAPGGEFFIEVLFTDPDGITRVSPLLVNSRPTGLAGELAPDQPPFSVVGAPTGDCRLGLLPTVVRCVFRVRVAEDAQNISELPGAGGEFAYVFRARAADGLGNSVNRPVRGYVVVTPQ